jgi:LacI family transcriptional regulator
MTGSKATLRNIATALGVSSTTVHRALQDKEGVSAEMREKIKKTAASMGYRTNYMAATLKRKPLRIAIVLPDPSDESRFFYGNLWDGIRNFFQEAIDFNIEIIEYVYPLAYGANGTALQEIYENKGEIDGLLTMATDHAQASYYLERFAARNIPTVFIGSDMYPDLRLCCVKAYDEMAGSLAAELLTVFHTDSDPKKIVITGHFGPLVMRDQYLNAYGFEHYLRANAPHISPITVRGEDMVETGKLIEQILRQESDIYAIYSCSARYTVLISEIVSSLGMTGKVKLIGSDCFTESIQLLREGHLVAIIDKKVMQQGYLAARTLFSYLVKGEYPKRSVINVRPEAVLRSNVDTNLVTHGSNIEADA